MHPLVPAGYSCREEQASQLPNWLFKELDLSPAHFSGVISYYISVPSVIQAKWIFLSSCLRVSMCFFLP